MVLKFLKHRFCSLWGPPDTAIVCDGAVIAHDLENQNAQKAQDGECPAQLPNMRASATLVDDIETISSASVSCEYDEYDPCEEERATDIEGYESVDIADSHPSVALFENNSILPLVPVTTSERFYAPPPLGLDLRGSSYGPHLGRCYGMYCRRCYKYACPKCGTRSNRLYGDCITCLSE